MILRNPNAKNTQWKVITRNSTRAVRNCETVRERPESRSNNVSNAMKTMRVAAYDCMRPYATFFGVHGVSVKWV